MYNRRVGLLSMAIALLGSSAVRTAEQIANKLPSDAEMGMMLKYNLDTAYRRVDSSGRPSGAARAKRIARKRRNIRARSAK